MPLDSLSPGVDPALPAAEAPPRPKRYFGTGLPYIDLDDLTGHLVVVEGSDGVGRTTHISMLRNWLEVKGFGVVETGWTRSNLVGSTIDLAKEGHGINVLTLNLLYATDFADRLEHEIIPALRSGFVVLADRYVYTAMARAAARGADLEWIRSLYGFAIEPDMVIYLNVDINTLVHRVIKANRLDYWEAGMDQNPGCDPYESFCTYQSKVLREFNRLARQFGFRKVDARRPVKRTQLSLRRCVAELLHIEMTPEDRDIGSSNGRAVWAGATS